MSCENTPLVCLGRSDEEIKRLRDIFITTLMLYKPTVHDASTGRVVEPAVVARDEESLVDPLVHNN